MKLGHWLQSIFKWAWQQFCSPEFWRYFAIGCSAVLFDMATLYWLKTIIGLTAVWSIIINQVVISTYVFLLNKYWVFASSGALARQAVRYFSLAITNYIIAIVWMWIFNEQLGFNYLLVRLANIALSTVWNFLLYRFFVYSHKDDR